MYAMAGKLPSIELRDNLGKASYNIATKRIDYPSLVPASRLKKSGMKKGRKVLVGRVKHSQIVQRLQSESGEDEDLSSTHN